MLLALTRSASKGRWYIMPGTPCLNERWIVAPDGDDMWGIVAEDGSIIAHEIPNSATAWHIVQEHNAKMARESMPSYNENNDLQLLSLNGRLISFRQVGWVVQGGNNDGLFLSLDWEAINTELLSKLGGYAPVYREVGTD
jgi:hypothetical protein